MTRRSIAFALTLTGAACAQYGEDPGLSEEAWKPLEAPLLTDHLQLTSRDMFVKAGEAYFDPTAEWIIFQAVPVPPAGQAPSPHYSMYVAPLIKNTRHDITGMGEPILLSEPGSANTCGWFHPSVPGLVLFGSTVVPPSADEIPGYDSGRYRWAFPIEMEVVIRYVPEIAASARIDEVPEEYAHVVDKAEPLFERPGYTAEASWSADGRYVLYAQASVEKSLARRPDADIWIFDTETGEHHEIVAEVGYDGGPFFSPDDMEICYRSDRRLDNLLQLFITELEYDASGAVSKKRERPLTANTHVNWAPYWHPSGEFLVYASSAMGHTNYEVFAIEAEGNPPAERRVTRASGADVLPVFSPDGQFMMWTGQRGPMIEGESRSSSQLWIARVRQDIGPDTWFDQIDAARAESIARAAVVEREGWEVAELELTARQSAGDVWRVQVWKLPKGPDSLRVVELARDGTLLQYVTPSGGD